MEWLLRYRRALLAGTFFVALLTAVITVAQQIRKGDGDPILFTHAGDLLLDEPQNLYLSPIPPHDNYYYYPPFFAILCLPLKLLPESLLLILWAAGSEVALAWSVAAFYAGMRGKRFREIPARDRWIVVAVTVAFIARPTIDHLRFGQVNIFILAAAVFAILAVERRRSSLSGVVFGLGSAVKLLLLPFGLVLALRSKYKAALAMSVTLVIATLVPAFFLGVSGDLALHRQWLDVVVLTTAAEWTTNGNISLAAQVTRFFTQATAFVYDGLPHRVTIVELGSSTIDILRTSVSVLVLLVIGFFTVWSRRRSDPLLRWGNYALTFALVPCFSTITELPHLVLLAPAAIWIAHAIFVEKVGDRLLNFLFLGAFVLTTLTSKTFVGEYRGKLFAATGVLIFGVVLLAAAVARGLYSVATRNGTAASKVYP